MSRKLYRQTDLGWQIFREPQSCALHAEFSEGSKLRLSYLAEPEMVYFSIFDRRWKLTDLLGTVAAQVEFLGIGRLYRCNGVKLSDPGGVHGYYIDNFALSFIDHFAQAEHLVFNVAEEGAELAQLAALELTGSEQAVRALKACNSNFYARALSDPEDDAS